MRFTCLSTTLYAICHDAGVRIVKALLREDYWQDAHVFADPDGNRIGTGRRAT
jgi:hypothetical protein